MSGYVWQSITQTRSRFILFKGEEYCCIANLCWAKWDDRHWITEETSPRLWTVPFFGLNPDTGCFFYVCVPSCWDAIQAHKLKRHPRSHNWTDSITLLKPFFPSFSPSLTETQADPRSVEVWRGADEWMWRVSSWTNTARAHMLLHPEKYACYTNSWGETGGLSHPLHRSLWLSLPLTFSLHGLYILSHSLCMFNYTDSAIRDKSSTMHCFVSSIRPLSDTWPNTHTLLHTKSMFLTNDGASTLLLPWCCYSLINMSASAALPRSSTALQPNSWV